MTYTLAELEDLLREWQKVLRLQDWVVTVKYARRYEMGQNRSGECSYVLPLKKAEIKLIDPNDHDPSWIEIPDSEVDLVHELEHLHFAPFMASMDEDYPGYVAMEQAIDLNAKALVALKRNVNGFAVDKEG